MSNKISRREMLKLTTMGVAAAGAGTIPMLKIFAVPPRQGTANITIQEDEKQYTKVVAAFKAAFPNINVTFVNVTGVDHAEVASKILAMLAAGQSVDIGYAATEATQLYAGEGLADSLTKRVTDSKADLMEYFSDVNPLLTETMMYKGDLYQLPRDFNAANMYFNTGLLKQAGLSMPAEDWTKDDFVKYATAMTGLGSAKDTFGYGWTNRLWGSWTPWFFVNDTNLLVEEKSPGGDWMWSTFYANDPQAKGRGGGYNWPSPQANNPKMLEALTFVVGLTTSKLTPAVDMGGGGTLQGFFTSGKLGMTVGGGFWSGGLIQAGMKKGDFDVQFWPKWVTQRHQLGVGAAWLLKGSPVQDSAWEFVKFNTKKEVMDMIGFFQAGNVTTTPVRRSMNTADRYGASGPANWHVFYDTLDKRPDTGPIPAPKFSIQETDIYTRYTAQAVNGQLSPKDALDGMQKELLAAYAQNA
ncbi:MAG: twin-arginine translocation signal domain-containing protein [Aggregatilineales bacterium]